MGVDVMNKNPEVSVDVNGTVISMTTDEHMELNEKNLFKAVKEIISKKDEIEDSVDGWFPCGFAKLNISGNSEFVRWMKEHGVNTRDKTYELGRVRITRNNYSGGYDVHLDYKPEGAMQSQSLNFKRPLYQLFQDYLGLMGVRAELRTKLD